MEAWEEMSVFLELIRAHLCVFIIKTKVRLQELDDTKLAAEPKYPINFTQPNKRFVLSLHYNASNIFLFVNATKTSQLKAKKSEIKIIYTVFR